MIRAAAPASTANLGPGFDAAAAALDLWNELTVEPADGLVVEIEGEGADELPRDASHLTLRAFAVHAPVDGRRFRFVNRIPLERGLGSSAAAVALGLVAGAAAAGTEPALADGAELEGHVDNLAAALLGGVALSWRNGTGPHARRVAATLPLVPVLAIPPTRTNTARSRGALPETVSHADAAATAGAAALLGAAIASGSAELLRHAFHDRLHEQYRAADAPLLAALRGAGLDATLSGSGPSVVAWADPARTSEVADAVAAACPPSTTVLPLRVAREGARLL